MSAKPDYRKWAGTKLGPYRLEVSPQRSELLSKAICGKVRDGIAPPTYLTIAREGEFEFLQKADLPISRILHGEQCYEYLEPIKIEQTLEYETIVKDVYEKRGGSAMTFFILESTFRSEGKEVAKSRTNFILRALKQGAAK